ncbi:hypothetical protein HXX76_011068 [Chlamydomonas incerta]|uniref:Uncharacterized protein n=1 Tax=Chlamydomonas incerta TaxID=51695 RepID=A0A835SYV1_CHLIN|nr:hypothetical protein HXX76_011068 [Chlamydomonas incerta]|eukprot:KAG2429300.1 hypothetical protein HXX76_011068 [Chlamydomonas incerta]
MYLDEEDQVEGAAGTWAASGWAGATAAESGLVVEAEVVSVPTGAEAAQYIVFEGDEENEEEEEKEEKGREGAGRDAGAARAGRFVFVPDVEPRSPGRSGPRRAS